MGSGALLWPGAGRGSVLTGIQGTTQGERQPPQPISQSIARYRRLHAGPRDHTRLSPTPCWGLGPGSPSSSSSAGTWAGGTPEKPSTQEQGPQRLTSGRHLCNSCLLCARLPEGPVGRPRGIQRSGLNTFFPHPRAQERPTYALPSLDERDLRDLLPTPRWFRKSNLPPESDLRERSPTALGRYRHQVRGDPQGHSQRAPSTGAPGPCAHQAQGAWTGREQGQGTPVARGSTPERQDRPETRAQPVSCPPVP